MILTVRVSLTGLGVGRGRYEIGKRRWDDLAWALRHWWQRLRGWWLLAAAAAAGAVLAAVSQDFGGVAAAAFVAAGSAVAAVLAERGGHARRDRLRGVGDGRPNRLGGPAGWAPAD
ncbi:hypothetical protein GCM10007977_084060 [Dactylosporangium sucinum]|uniref:Uncharacterized protein n=1 Tax=Dactylosporangium sucinum TaxID=1424081 RepID=A0A917X486_9ACTN|nr:hypothetical protein GCM10007977_084060 [Dactylosporangium sucinum]